MHNSKNATLMWIRKHPCLLKSKKSSHHLNFHDCIAIMMKLIILFTVFPSINTPSNTRFFIRKQIFLSSPGGGRVKKNITEQMLKCSANVSWTPTHPFYPIFCKTNPWTWHQTPPYFLILYIFHHIWQHPPHFLHSFLPKIMFLWNIITKARFLAILWLFDNKCMYF